MDLFQVAALGFVRSPRTAAVDDDWAPVEAVIELDPAAVTVEATRGLAEFSHLEVLFLFHLVDEAKVERGARHPRGNRSWPEAGVLAQRNKDRPNRLGVTTCELVAVTGLTVTVCGLDAVEGTPVLDLKPYFAEFAPRSEVRQPAWSHELMATYW
ncbi:SAM-dependent methyltransferase [Pseudofrankia sp. DC12]|uniref:SAM-dependent methyltransferase n=1 Tax=Pseudofrankia sp. DC12 TaxID=683315 RepID=UPI0005F765AE|nr:SAM-dependent methyltransferase [Pseudofrankia sp. DC12]